MAVGLSGLCLAHCVLTIVLVSTLSVAGTVLTDPSVHELGLTVAVALAAVALGQGFAAHRAVRPALVGIGGLMLMAAGLVVPHGLLEVVATIAGVLVLAGAHLMNARLRSR